MTTKDPTLPMREQASRFPDVDEGTACTQSSFKVGKKSFFFVGEQGGRFKAMFKLQDSMDEARALAKKDPDDFQAQAKASGWVTARFSAEKPMAKRLWQKWLLESYTLSGGGNQGKAAAKKTTKKKKVTKKATQKKAAKKKAIKKKAAKVAKTKAAKKSRKKKR